jgi:hypothetical protein
VHDFFPVVVVVVGKGIHPQSCGVDWDSDCGKLVDQWVLALGILWGSLFGGLPKAGHSGIVVVQFAEFRM